MALQNVEANITLDLYNHDTTPATVKAIQLDSQTRYVAAMLQNVGMQYDVDSGATVQLIVVRPDNVGVQITGETFEYGEEGAQFLGPYAELTQVALAVSGKMRGQFKITSGTQILRTEIFAINNGVALDASTDEWADEYDGYNLEEMATSIETNTADIASLEADVSQLKEGLSDISDRTGVTSHPTVTFTNHSAVKPATGLVNGTNAHSYSNYVQCGGYDIVILTMILYKANYDYGLAFYDESEVYISGVQSRYDTSLEVSTWETREIPIPSNAKYFRTTWIASDSPTYVDWTFSCALVKTGSLPAEIVDKTTATSENVLDKTNLTIGKYINKSGSIGTSSSYAYTDYIKVREGDVVKGYANKQSTLTLRYVCAYDNKKVVIASAGAENASSYTVPNGVSFVRITGYARTDNSGINSPYARIFLNGTDGKYQAYKFGDVTDFATENYAATQILKNYPLTTITPYMLNLLSYRPLGTLTKGYICLVSDDGDADVATYTIPMLQSKGDIPCTFAVMKSSEVFSTQSGTDALIDAVQNHNCEIAQHGGITWDQYDELTLNSFFDDEKAYWDSIGLTPYGAVCPAHNINNLIRVICGGRFGCVRTGYADGVPYYPNYTNGAKSNIFGLTSQSSVDSTLNGHKTTLDYTKANNLLRIIHWHENELTAEKKTQLEGIIDYAQEIGLTFITMKDIPTII